MPSGRAASRTRRSAPRAGPWPSAGPATIDGLGSWYLGQGSSRSASPAAGESYRCRRLWRATDHRGRPVLGRRGPPDRQGRARPGVLGRRSDRRAGRRRADPVRVLRHPRAPGWAHPGGHGQRRHRGPGADPSGRHLQPELRHGWGEERARGRADHRLVSPAGREGPHPLELRVLLRDRLPGVVAGSPPLELERHARQQLRADPHDPAGLRPDVWPADRDGGARAGTTSRR